MTLTLRLAQMGTSGTILQMREEAAHTPSYTFKETLQSPAVKYPVYLSLKVNTYAVSHTP